AMIARLALLCLVLAGCGLRTPAFDVSLVPNDDLTSLDDLRAHVVRLEYMLDSPAGLYPQGSERVSGQVSIEDADGDPSDLELVVRLPFEGRLPRVRIEEGSLPDVPLDLRVRGLLADGRVYAEGMTRGLRMEARPKDVR